MDFNLITNVKSCYIEIPQLLYYSHIPTAAVAFFLGLFIFIKNRDLMGRMLFFISALFSIWVSLNLYLWLGHDSRLIMFVWSLFGTLSPLIFFTSLYFIYSFVNKSVIGFKLNALFLLLMTPAIVFSYRNVRVFNNLDCVANTDKIYSNYIYSLEIIVILWVLFFLVFKYRKVSLNFKKPFILSVVGLELFLLSFLSSDFIAGLLYDNKISYAFEIEQYGLFGMTFFMAMLAFLIVRYRAFNIKLIGAQALIVSLIILVGSQFFFSQNTTSSVLTGVTLVLVGFVGIAMIRSVKKEVERKEQLQIMADKLASANDQLRKLDNAKTEFLSIASHQLRTPLTAIKGFVSLLLEGSYGELKPEQIGALEKVYSSGDRLIQLVEDLLNVSRIESGRMQFTMEKGSMEQLLKELYENFLLIAKTKKFYLDMKIPEKGLPDIVFDYSKVRELVSNFIDNALKYTEKGGVTVSAEKRASGVVVDENGFIIPGKEAGFGEVIRVTVSDTGIGVPKEEIPYLFKKFSRGKDVSRLSVGGTGLGLYVGKAIAEAHGGAVWVESDGAGQGSRFIIEIPVEIPIK